MNAPYSSPPPYSPYGHPSYPPPAPPRPRGISPWIWVLLGVVLLGLGTCGGLVGLAILGNNMEPGGVMLGSQVPDAKRAKLEERGLLKKEDQLVAFYDASLSLDLSEVMVLTSTQLRYANAGHVTTVRLEDVASIDHRVEGITGDVIEIATTKSETREASGATKAQSDRIRLEIAHLNNGISFLNALEDEVRKKQPAVVVRRQTPR